MAQLARLGRRRIGESTGQPVRRSELPDSLRVPLSPTRAIEPIARAVRERRISHVDAAFALVGLALRVGFSPEIAMGLARHVTQARAAGLSGRDRTELELLCGDVLAGNEGDAFEWALDACAPRPAPQPAPPAAAPPVDERQQRRAAAKARLAPVLRWLDAALRPPLPQRIDPPAVELDDLRLALRWMKRVRESRDPALSLSDLEGRYAGEHDVGRMLSARVAEKAAVVFFGRHGITADDVSGEQLGDRSDAWETHDLEAGGRRYDLKNSRRSPSAPDTYVEHCVPEFKTRRGENVTILGMLSTWRHVPWFLPGNGDPWHESAHDHSLVVMGETDRARLDALRDHFSRRAPLDITFSRPGSDAEFFPPWVFDLPSFCYRHRDHALGQVPADAFADPGPWRELGENPLPLCLATGHPWGGGFEHPWEAGFFQLLRDSLDRARTAEAPRGLSLPFVFLSILAHFTRMLAPGSDDRTGYHPAGYRRFLFRAEKDEPGWSAGVRTPLGICDPLCTVDSLIRVLEVLWRGDHAQLRRFRRFRLARMRVLKGTGAPPAGEQPAEQEETLVAYCGGWTTSEGGRPMRCGFSPLVLGSRPPGAAEADPIVCEPCAHCRRLVCNRCGHCGDNCPGIAERRASPHGSSGAGERARPPVRSAATAT